MRHRYIWYIFIPYPFNGLWQRDEHLAMLCGTITCMTALCSVDTAYCPESNMLGWHCALRIGCVQERGSAFAEAEVQKVQHFYRWLTSFACIGYAIQQWT